MSEIGICSRCILLSDFPHIHFDESGVCNYCREWDRKWKGYNFENAEKSLIKIFDSVKRLNRKYDCLVPYSGGRDSSYVLYLVTKKYKMNPLAVTFNNGFLSDLALKNIMETIKILQVDHVLHSYSWGDLKAMYRAMIRASGEFCSICSIGINHVKTLYQKKFNIPLIITGTSARIDEASPFEINCSHPIYVKKVLRQTLTQDQIDDFVLKRKSELSIFELIKRKLSKSDHLGIDMPDYVRWHNSEIQDLLMKELKWLTPDKNKDHIDCRYASIKYYFKNKQIPGFIHKREKLSQLIRDGQILREEALAEMKLLIAHAKVPTELNEFLTLLDMTEADIWDIQNKSYLNIVTLEELKHDKLASFRLLRNFLRTFCFCGHH